MAMAHDPDALHQAKGNGKGNGLLLYQHHYSFYSQKVIMALHEKKLPFKSQIVDLTTEEQFQPWFLELNPRAEVPVLKDGDKVIAESDRIIDYLEDNFSNGDSPRLIPLDLGCTVRQKVVHYRYVIEKLPIGAITMGSFFHPEFCSKPKAPFVAPVRKLLMAAERRCGDTLRLHASKNPSCEKILTHKATFQDHKHERIRSKDQFKILLDEIEMILEDIERELASHDNCKNRDDWWLCSTRYTIADINLTLLLDRLYRLGLDTWFWENGSKPHISEYYAKAKQRDSFKRTIPSNFVYLKILLRMHSPLLIGFGILTAVAVTVGGLYYYFKNSGRVVKPYILHM